MCIFFVQEGSNTLGFSATDVLFGVVNSYLDYFTENTRFFIFLPNNFSFTF